MLPLDDILEIAQLLDQTGEPRPGFLHDEKANLEGYGAGADPCTLITCQGVPAGPRKRNERTITVRLEYSEDLETGDVRIVQK